MQSLRALAARTTPVLLLTYLLAGCAAIGEPKTPEQVVEARAQERWNAMVKGDIPAAYGYLSPGSRAVMNLDAYRSTIRLGFWSSAKVDRVQCASPDACEAQVMVEYNFRGSRLKTPVKESWVKQDADWWYVQR